MYIKLFFDYYERTVYIPDGYVKDVKELQNNFLEWMKEQPYCIVDKKGQSGYSYNETDFLRYLNTVLISGGEKAYFFDNIQKKKYKTIHF